MDKVDCLKQIIGALNNTDPETIEGDDVCELLDQIAEALGNVSFADDSEVVHKFGSETIDGFKTFTSNPTVLNSYQDQLTLKSSNENWKTNPSGTLINTIRFADMYGSSKGRLGTRHTADIRTVFFEIANPSGGYHSISINILADGTIYATAPETEDTHPDDAIVTKKYLLDKIASLEARTATLEGTSS